MTKRRTRAEVPGNRPGGLPIFSDTQVDWEREVEEIAAAATRVTQYRGRLGEGHACSSACLTEYERLRERLTRAAAYASCGSPKTDPTPQPGRERQRAGPDGADGRGFRLPAVGTPGPSGRHGGAIPGRGARPRAVPALAGTGPGQAGAHPASRRPSRRWPRSARSPARPTSSTTRPRPATCALSPLWRTAKRCRSPSPPTRSGLERSADAGIRRAAFRSFSAGLRRYQNTLAAAFAAEVKKNVVLARLRGTSPRRTCC